MEPLSVSFSLEDLLRELESLDSDSRSSYLLAIMLRDGFSVIATHVPERYRPGLEELIRALANSAQIVDWGKNVRPNVYRGILNDWVAELNRNGWPPPG